MTNEQLKKLENDLWDSANSFRAYGGIKASDYSVPVLGIIFLKFADNKYSLYEEQIIKEYNKQKGKRAETPIENIAIKKCGFYLPKQARYKHLLELPQAESMASAIELAIKGNTGRELKEDEREIRGLEEYLDDAYKDILPTTAYYDIESKKNDILPGLFKTFSDIPKDASGDLFGKIYEYFLGKFAMSEGQKGGEFFTPTSVVKLIVEFIEPYKGKIFDPACGSGGMFVQSGAFLRKTKHDLNDIYVCGQEFMGETVRLSKMNLLVNNLRGEIKELNSYQYDGYNSYGKFDFVMANPPFNVKSVKEQTVANDKRFYEYGLPKNKGKKDDKITDANYLWISLFATSLNEKGRAGFVMPNSASDARNSEYEIRKKIVDSGIVDCMLSMPSNMFLTVTLPATLWFLDKNKINTDISTSLNDNRKDKILFIDARNVYKQIDRAHREWTDEHLQNLTAIVRLYRGENERFLDLIHKYIVNSQSAFSKIKPAKQNLQNLLKQIITGIRKYNNSLKDNKKAKYTDKKLEILKETDFYNKIGKFEPATPQKIDDEQVKLDQKPEETQLKNEEQHKTAEFFDWFEKQEKLNFEALKTDTNTIIELWKTADTNIKQKTDKNWTKNDLNRADKILEQALQAYTQAKEDFEYWLENINWLQKRFPDAEYADVIGLCKLADKSEYADEQDYSLNAGRYVGVEIEDDNISEEEFKKLISEKAKKLGVLNVEAKELENLIITNLNKIYNEEK